MKSSLAAVKRQRFPARASRRVRGLFILGLGSAMTRQWLGRQKFKKICVCIQGGKLVVSKKEKSWLEMILPRIKKLRKLQTFHLTCFHNFITICQLLLFLNRTMQCRDSILISLLCTGNEPKPFDVWTLTLFPTCTLVVICKGIISFLTYLLTYLPKATKHGRKSTLLAIHRRTLLSNLWHML